MKCRAVIVTLIALAIVLGMVNVVSANTYSIDSDKQVNGNLFSHNNTYSDALNGSQILEYSGGDVLQIGQWGGWNDSIYGYKHWVLRTYISFNTSSIPDNHTVVSANISMVYGFANAFSSYYELEVYNIDFGDTLDADDWTISDENYEGVIFNKTTEGFLTRHTTDVSANNINTTGLTQYVLKTSQEGSIPSNFTSDGYSALNSSAIDIFSLSGYEIKLNLITTETPEARIEGIQNGSQQSVGEITMDGSGSYDGDGTVVNYTWKITKDGVDEYVYGESPTYDFEEGDYTIELTITDDLGATATSTITFTVYTEIGFLQLGLISILFLLIVLLTIGKIKDGLTSDRLREA